MIHVLRQIERGRAGVPVPRLPLALVAVSAIALAAGIGLSFV